MKNKLEHAETTWNKSEQARTSWNELELPENDLEPNVKIQTFFTTAPALLTYHCTPFHLVLSHRFYTLL